MKLCSQGFLLFVIFAVTIMADLDSSYPICDKPKLANGRVRLAKKGRIAKFRCNLSFQLFGEKYATCLRGKWDSKPTCVKAGCVSLPTFNNGQTIETYDGAVINFICNTGYSMIGSPRIYCDGSRWNGSLPRCIGYARSPSTMCDFESPYICGWTQDPFHIFNWSRQNYQTPSRNIGTGPSYDHTLGPDKGGYYMFIETSSPRIENDTARLLSPIFSPQLTTIQPSCFIFWYHMYGATTGILNVYVKPQNVVFDSTLLPKFTKSGNQGDEWFQGIVQLPKMNVSFQVIVEALRGSSYVSDIAIDDVKITNGSECADMSSTESLLQNTRTTRSAGAMLTYHTPPPLPPLPPFPSPEVSVTQTNIETDTHASELLTFPMSTDSYIVSNLTQIMSNTTSSNPQQFVHSTTEESKRIPIPAEPTPLILIPLSAIIRRTTEQTTTPAAKVTTMPSVFTNSTKAVNLTTPQNTPPPVTAIMSDKKSTIKPTTRITTTTKTSMTTTKATMKITKGTMMTTKPTLKTTQTMKTKTTTMTTKPIFIPIKRNTTKFSTTEFPKTLPTKFITKKRITRKPIITSSTTQIKPIVPVYFPELKTIPTSTTEQPVINFNENEQESSENTYVTETIRKVTRGKEWIQRRTGLLPKAKQSTSISSIAGILIAVILVIAGITVSAYFYVRHRKLGHRQSHIADDSDVRFLTSDEVLDFSLARPSDSGDDDL